MSFTLMRYKDGMPKPIKMSVWDAFKGAPSPKPRLHRCNCCKQLHKPGIVNSTNVLPSSNTSAPTPQPENKVTTDAKDNEKKDATDSPFTAEEEAKLLEMRAKNPTESWRVTLENIGKPDVAPGIAKARFKELQAERNEKDKNGAAANNDDKAVDEGGDKSESKAEKADKDTDESKMTKKEKKAAKSAGGEDSVKQEADVKKSKSDGDKAGSTTAISGDKAPLSKSTSKSSGGIIENSIKEWAKKYDKQKWVAAASKHFDLTGERITPQQAQKLAAI